MVSIKDIAREVSMNPRYVRELLRQRRRHEPWTKWELTPDEARDVVQWLRERKKRNGGGE